MMAPCKRQVKATRHLICGNSSKWEDFVKDGCEKSWAEVQADRFNFENNVNDFAKAFDTVPHQRLPVKLAGYGIGGKVEGRRQRVLVDGSKSSWSLVTSGIPQGSVLGPMLFVCYINDMPDVVDSPIHMFADDTKIFRQMTAQSDQVSLQTDLRQLEAWIRKWQLRFNEEKCKVMHLGQHNHHYDYTITSGGKDTTLGETTNERDLGVQIDRDLKFEVEMVANKANKMLGLIIKKIIYIPGWTNHKKTIHEPGQTYSRIWQCSLGPNTQERPTDD